MTFYRSPFCDYYAASVVSEHRQKNAVGTREGYKSARKYTIVSRSTCMC